LNIWCVSEKGPQINYWKHLGYSNSKLKSNPKAIHIIGLFNFLMCIVIVSANNSI